MVVLGFARTKFDGFFWNWYVGRIVLKGLKILREMNCVRGEEGSGTVAEQVAEAASIFRQLPNQCSSLNFNVLELGK